MNETVNIAIKLSAETQQAEQAANALSKIQDMAHAGAEPVAALLSALESIGASVTEVNRLRDSLQALGEGDARTTGHLESIRKELDNIIQTAQKVPQLDISGIVGQAQQAGTIKPEEAQAVTTFLSTMEQTVGEARSESEGYKAMADFSTPVFEKAMREPDRVTTPDGQQAGGEGGLFNQIRMFEMPRKGPANVGEGQDNATGGEAQDNTDAEKEVLERRRENAELEKKILEDKGKGQPQQKTGWQFPTFPNPLNVFQGGGKRSQDDDFIRRLKHTLDESAKNFSKAGDKLATFKMQSPGGFNMGGLAIGGLLGLIMYKANEAIETSARLDISRTQTRARLGSLDGMQDGGQFGYLQAEMSRMIRESASATNEVDRDNFRQEMAYTRARGLDFSEISALVQLQRTAGVQGGGAALGLADSLAQSTGVGSGRLSELVDAVSGLTETLAKDFVGDPLAEASRMMAYAGGVFTGDQAFRGQGAMGADFVERLRGGLSGISGVSRLLAMQALGTTDLWTMRKQLEEMSPQTQSQLIEYVANNDTFQGDQKKWLLDAMTGGRLKGREIEAVLDNATGKTAAELMPEVEAMQTDFTKEGQQNVSRYERRAVERERVQDIVGSRLQGVLDMEIQLYKMAGDLLSGSTGIVDTVNNAMTGLAEMFGKEGNFSAGIGGFLSILGVAGEALSGFPALLAKQVEGLEIPSGGGDTKKADDVKNRMDDGEYTVGDAVGDTFDWVSEWVGGAGKDETGKEPESGGGFFKKWSDLMGGGLQESYNKMEEFDRLVTGGNTHSMLAGKNQLRDMLKKGEFGMVYKGQDVSELTGDDLEFALNDVIKMMLEAESGINMFTKPIDRKIKQNEVDDKMTALFELENRLGVNKLSKEDQAAWFAGNVDDLMQINRTPTPYNRNDLGAPLHPIFGFENAGSSSTASSAPFMDTPPSLNAIDYPIPYNSGDNIYNITVQATAEGDTLQKVEQAARESADRLAGDIQKAKRGGSTDFQKQTAQADPSKW